MKKAGIVIILFGLILTIFTAVTVFTKEKVVDIGNLEITKEKKHNLNWSPIIGVAFIAAGGIMVWQGTKK